MVDIWRLRNSNERRYTWRQKTPRIHCRLYYFLVSHHITDIITNQNIFPSFLSDHSPITICLAFIEKPTLGSGHWKLNTSLLSDQNYIQNMKANIARWKEEYKDIDDLNLKWEILKYEIRKFSIAFSKNKKTITRNRKDELERKLQYLESLEYQNIENIHNQLYQTKEELNKIYEDEGAEGEKSTAYFFNLEKNKFD